MMNRLPLEFTLHLGDYLDLTVNTTAYEKTLLGLMEKTKNKITSPFYHLIGNHDCEPSSLTDISDFYDNIDDAYYSDFDSFSHAEGTLGYYHIKVRGIDLFVLNTNQDSGELDGEWELDNTQEVWLQDELNGLTDANARVVITSHVSLAETAAIPYHRVSLAQQLRIQSMLEVWEAANGIILGVFNGHQHQNFHYTINGIEYIAMSAQIRNTSSYKGVISEMAFSYLSWNETTKIFKIEGFGNQDSYEFDYSSK